MWTYVRFPIPWRLTRSVSEESRKWWEGRGRTDYLRESRNDALVDILPRPLMRMRKVSIDGSTSPSDSYTPGWRGRGKSVPLAPYVDLFDQQRPCAFREEAERVAAEVGYLRVTYTGREFSVLRRGGGRWIVRTVAAAV